MNIISHKMPIILSTIVLVMGLLYACPDANNSSGDSTSSSSGGNTSSGGGNTSSGGGNTPSLPILTDDITYDKDRIAQGIVGTATPSSATITDFSGLTFSLKSISTHTGTQVLPTISDDGIITTTTRTSAGSYRVTIAPDGTTVTGDPVTVDFYVTVKATSTADLDTKLKKAITDYRLTGDFNYIDTSAVTNMTFLFASGYAAGSEGTLESARTYVAGFNGDISKWDVSAVTNFHHMFHNAGSFNQNIGGWTVSAGENFKFMFEKAAVFNQDISKWDVAKGTNFSGMFQDAAVFNQNIGGWTVIEGRDFHGMFRGTAVFNQDISEWNVAKGTDFRYMFYEAKKFSQDLSKWKVDSSDQMLDMFTNSAVPNFPSWYQP